MSLRDEELKIRQVAVWPDSWEELTGRSLRSARMGVLGGGI